MNGQGPKEYNMVLDINFNPYLKGIDMLNPYGKQYILIVRHLDFYLRDNLNQSFL